MAKLDRERRLRERRSEKQARKEARRQAATDTAYAPDEAPAEVLAGDSAAAADGYDASPLSPRGDDSEDPADV